MLRDYQQLAIRQIREKYISGIRKVMLHMATGAGKTVIFSYAIKASAEKGMKCVMVVRGRELVEQASQRLARENVEHGVRMAGHWRVNYQAPIQVCSIDTLIARDKWPDADLVVIDEADQATSKGYHRLSKKYPHAFFLSVTATPYTSKSLKHVASTVVKPIGIKELIEQGHLVAPRYYAPSEPDLKGVKIVKNEYENQAIEKRMGVLTGDIISHWKKLGQKRPTICFAVNIRHSHGIRDLFEREGVNAEHCDADTSDEERQAIQKRLKSGETSVVCNVGILGRGVDLPFVSCLILARPTRSYNLFIQQCGRGTRPYPGKSDFIILDHSSNITRHGFIENEPPADLEGKVILERKTEVKICTVCYLAYSGKDCPDCGHLESNVRRDIEVEEGILREIKLQQGDEVLSFITQCKTTAKQKGYKPGWVWHQVIRRYGERANAYLPHWWGKPKDNVFGDSPYKCHQVKSTTPSPLK